MTVEVVGGILLAVLTLYAVLAGADFGGGLWDLLAGGDRTGRVPRGLIDETITPVWESNHVWLIFALVIFWTGFPRAFAAVMTATALPLWLAVFGIVLRGAGFAFRKEAKTLRWRRLLGATFAFSSLITPFFMGTVVGAVAAGGVKLDAQHSTLMTWTGTTSILVGCLFVAVSGYEAAVFLIGEAAGRQNRRLERYFRRRATIAGPAAGALSLAVLASLHSSNRALYDRLTSRALPLVIVAGACGIIVIALLLAGRSRGLRVLSAAGVAAVVSGFGVAQYPILLPRTGLTLSAASAPHATLVTLIAVSVLAVVLVVPGFLVLFWLHGRQLLESDDPPTTAR